jgi:hypothetical protein
MQPNGHSQPVENMATSQAALALLSANVQQMMNKQILPKRE